MTKDITVKEIKEELTEKGIDFDNNAKKDELLALLQQSHENDELVTEDVEEVDYQDESVEEEDEYIVVKDFRDIKDDNHIYREHDPYPREGKATQSRIEELSTKRNKRKEVLIKKVEK